MIFFKKVYWTLCVKIISFFDQFELKHIFYLINYKKPDNRFPAKGNIYLEPQISPFVGIVHKLGDLLAAYSICNDFEFHGIIFDELVHENWPALKINNRVIGKINICSKKTSLKRIKLPRLNFDLAKDLERFKKYIQLAKNDVIFVLEKDQFYKDLSNSGSFLEKLLSKKFSLPKKKDFIIGIHVRKGDILKSKKFIRRNISYDYFNNTIDCVNEALKNLGFKDYKTVVFSNDYSSLNKLDFKWNADTSNNSFNSFIRMSECDILITSLSSFSYKPALVNKNLVFYPKNFWHKYPKDNRYVELGLENNKLIIKNAINTFFRKN